MESETSTMKSLKIGVATREWLLEDLKHRMHKARVIFAKYDPKIMDHQTLYESLLEYTAWMHRYMINSLDSIKRLEESWKEDGTKPYYDTSLIIDGGKPIRGIFIPYSSTQVNAFGDIRRRRSQVVASTQTDETVSSGNIPPANIHQDLSCTGASGEKLRDKTAGLDTVNGPGGAEEEVLASLIGLFPPNSSSSLDVARGDARPRSSGKVPPGTTSSATTWPPLPDFWQQVAPEPLTDTASWNVEQSYQSASRPKTAMPSGKVGPDAFEVSMSRSAERIRSSIYDIQDFVASLSQMCIVPSRVKSDASIPSLSGNSSRYFDVQAYDGEEAGSETVRRSSSATDVIVTYRNPNGMSPKKSICPLEPGQWPQGKERTSKEGPRSKPLATSAPLVEGAVGILKNELVTRYSALSPGKVEGNVNRLDVEMIKTLERWRDEREAEIQGELKLELEHLVSVQTCRRDEETMTRESKSQGPPADEEDESVVGVGMPIETVGWHKKSYLEDNFACPEMIKKMLSWIDEKEKQLCEKELETKRSHPTPPLPVVEKVTVESPRQDQIEETPLANSPPPLTDVATGCLELPLSLEQFMDAEMKALTEKKELDPRRKQGKTKQPGPSDAVAVGPGNAVQRPPGEKAEPVSLLAGTRCREKSNVTGNIRNVDKPKVDGKWKPIGRKLQDELQEALKMEALLEKRKREEGWKRSGIPEKVEPLAKPRRELEVIDVKMDGSWMPTGRTGQDNNPKYSHPLVPIKEPYPRLAGAKPELGYADLASRRPEDDGEPPGPQERLIPLKDPCPALYSPKPEKTYGGIHKQLVEIGCCPPKIPKTIKAIVVGPNKVMKEAKLSVGSHIIPPKSKVGPSKIPRCSLTRRRSNSVPTNISKDPEFAVFVPREDTVTLPMSPRTETQGCQESRGPKVSHPFHVPGSRARYRGVSVDRKRYTSEYQASYKAYD